MGRFHPGGEGGGVPPLRRRVPFAAMQKEPKDRRGHGSLERHARFFTGKTLRVFRSAIPPDPLFTGALRITLELAAGAGSLMNGVES